MFEIGVLGFGGENEVVEEVFSFRNKVYYGDVGANILWALGLVRGGTMDRE